MPFSFTQIEKSKTHLIGVMFFFLVVSYTFFVIILVGAFRLVLPMVTTVETHPKAFLQIPSSGFFLTPFDIGISVAMGLVIGALHWLIVNNHVIEKILRVLNARLLNKDIPAEKIFADIIAEVSIAGGSKVTIEGVVVPSADLNAFALSDFDGRHVIGVTQGLLDKLTRPQLEAVVGHEAAHIFSQDCLLTTVAATLFGLFSALYEESKNVIVGLLETTERRVGGRPPLWTIVFPVIVCVVSFHARIINYLMAMFISRQKELRADATAVRLTRDPLSLAEALYTVSLYGNQLPRSNSLESIFIISPSGSWLDNQKGFWADLWSTHPPLEDRVQILLDMAHVDADSFVERFKPPQPSSKDDTPASAAGPEGTLWKVYGQQGWQGPLDLVEVAALAWIRPDTRIQRVGSEEIFRVVDDPILKGTLSQKSKSELKDVCCPRCRVELHSYLYEGVPIQSCPQCAGILGGERDIEWIMTHEDVGFTSKVRELAEKMKEQRPSSEKYSADIYQKEGLACPQCRHVKARMVRQLYDRAHPVEIDKCLFCGKVWFDRNELEILQYFRDETKNKTTERGNRS